MKLNKDQTQKIALGAMMLCGGVYAYFEFLLGPLTAEREAAIKETAALEPQIQTATQQVAKTKNLEAKAPEAQRLLDQVKAMIPDGSPIAWVPTKVTELLKREGIDKSTARMINELPEKELTGFAKTSWAVEIPSAGFLKFAAAISTLETQEPLMEIQGFDIEAGRENVEYQRMSFTLLNLVRL